MTDPKDFVNSLIADNPRGSRPCAVERNAPLAEALRHFLALKAAGETHLSLQFVYDGGLQEAFDGPSMTTVRRWARAQ